MQRSDTLWLVAFALGFGFTFMVAANPPGLGMFLFMNALIAALIYFGRKNSEAKELKRTMTSEVLVGIFTTFYVLLTIPYLYRMDVSIIVISMLVQLGLLLFGAVYYALPGAIHIVDLFSLIISPLALGITWIIESFKAFVDLFKDNANVVKLLLKIVLYTAVSLFVFIVFAKLLAQADAEFKKRIDYILESLKLSEVMVRMVFGVVVSFIAAGLLTIMRHLKMLTFLGVTKERALVQWEKAFSVAFTKRSDAILPIIVTVPILFLFALYVWVQFTYLFGQDMSAILSKYSIAEYVHRGFTELLVVAVLSYPILSWSMNQSRNEWKLPRIATFFVNTGIVSLLVVMLYSLFVRMNIYTTTYGPSVLRQYVIIGAVFVGIVLLAYEIIAAIKAAKPGFSLTHGRFFGDYTVAGIIAALALLTTLAVYPWNHHVLSRLASYYERTGNVDVFQLMQLSDEVQPEVYEFSKKLAADGAQEGSLLLNAHLASVRANYKKSREESIFTNVFGFNFSGAKLLGTATALTVDDTRAKVKLTLDAKVSSMKEQYMQAIARNDFNQARNYFDPQMKSNDIVGFVNGVGITVHNDTYEVMERGSYAEGLIGGNQKSIYQSAEFVVTRATDTVLGVSSTVPVTSPAPVKVVTTMSATSSMSLAYSIRNGRLVMTSSSLVLSYLPDAINDTQGNYVDGISDYGYSTYCSIPTLDMLYSTAKGCKDGSTNAEETYSKPDMLGDTAGMSPFKKSDFVTR
jgi:hypothetical protein